MQEFAPEDHANKAFGVVACTDSRMLPAACCALLSARNNISFKNVSYYLVGSDLTDEDKENLLKFSKERNIDIIVIEMTEENFSDEELRRYGKATLGRLHLPDLLPNSIDRLLYLDADVLVVSDISELFLKGIGGKPLAAVESLKVDKIDELRSSKVSLGLKESDPYFNSGVLLFDWQKTLEGRFLQRSYEKLITERRMNLPDQDALNSVFVGNWYKLDFAWNMRPEYISLEPKTKIVHFIGKNKPWMERSKIVFRRFRQIYREHLGENWTDFIREPGFAGNVALLFKYLKFSVKMRRRKTLAKRYYLEPSGESARPASP